MKRLLSLLLCIVMICLALTGCSESFLEQFKEDIKEYDDLVLPSEREDVVLDFYIICEAETTDRSKEDVERYINAHLSDLYKTTLDIHYLSMEEYQNTVLADAAKTGEERADIVLIAGYDMFNALYSQNLLAELTPFYSTKKYGLLNTLIASTLLKSSLITVKAYDEVGSPYDSLRYYTVPNNHVIGEYEYVIINKEIARQYNFSSRQLEAMTTYELTADLRAAIGDTADQYVKAVKGIYTDKAAYEAQGYHVNIVSYPVADIDEAFLSAFSIVRHELDTRYKDKEDDISIESKNIYNDHYERCMEIVYALSADVTLKNLLQYGHKGTNYTLDSNEVVTSYTEGAGVYKMNMLYTGNVFNAYYCEEIGWNAAAYNNGVEQNKESVVPVILPEEEPNE